MAEKVALPLYEKFDACLRDIGKWYRENRRMATFEEIEPIIESHFPSTQDVMAFLTFLNTDEGKDECLKWIRVVRLRKP
jgi:hypothetical protein